MLGYKYKTRGTSSPQGKAKVFFCCQKDDFKLHFSKISDDILSLDNCAIWYSENYDLSIDDEDRFSLKTMNLFVFPITMNLLNKENIVVTELIPFALENHIPVLPIAMEVGIERLYEEKFGKIHFLVDNSTNITEISRKWKMASFLSSVLAGDELSGKIREAFDAYVFMSYRKKDREHAQSLMRLIHEDEFCRDIAIWYDEFLNPGENFEESIRKAIEKSQLFLLVVTPNLFDVNNYVLTTEYPLAYDMDKPILPVEMMPTSSEKLADLYCGISKAMNYEDRQSIYNWIKEKMAETLEKKPNKDALHSFLIGCAYLYGIDVEVDRERALTLIRNAGYEDLDEAILKLVAMYKYGDGVAQNYKQAIHWQKRLVSKYQSIVEKTLEEESIVMYIRYLSHLANLFYEAKDLEKALDEYEKIYKISKKMCAGLVGKNLFCKIKNLIKRFSSNTHYTYISFYYLVYSVKMIWFINDDFRGPLRVKWMKEALNIATTTLRNFGYEEVQRECIAIFGKAGEICLEEEDYKNAAYWFNKELDVFERMEQLNNELQYELSKITCLCHKATHKEALAENEEALFCYRQAIGIYEMLYQEHQYSILLLELGKQVMREGLILLKLQDRARAFSSFKRAENLFKSEQIAELTATREENAMLSLYLGDYYLQEGEREKVKSYYDVAISVFTNKIEDKLDSQSYLNAALGCMKIGDYYFQDQNFTQSLEWYKKSEEYYRDVAFFSKSLRDLRLYVVILKRLYGNEIELQNYVKVKEWIDKACAITEKIVKYTGSDSDIKSRDALYGEREKVKIASQVSLSLSSGDAIEELTLKSYVQYQGELIENTPTDEIESFIEARIGKLFLEFWEMNPFYEHRDRFCDLGELLLKESYKYKDFKEKDELSIKIFLSRKIKRWLLESLDDYNLYDENRMLMVLYCSCRELKYGTSDNARDDGEMRAFYDFYTSVLPFWNFPIDEVKHPMLWVYMNLWVNRKEGDIYSIVL